MGQRWALPYRSPMQTLRWESLQQRAFNSFRPAHKPLLRYVDDCFSVFKEEALTSFKVQLNSKQDSIKFTGDFEQPGQLPLLEVLVRRQGKYLTFSLYRKTIRTGGYETCLPQTVYNSLTSKLYKKG